jgi:hypothetical protein
MRGESQLVGAAGAYYVAAQLSERGWIASLTWGDAPRTDVLAQRLDLKTRAAIQVKTRKTGQFQLGKAAEMPSPRGANEWFVLVDLGGPRKRPDFYVVPRNHIAALTYLGYYMGQHTLGRGGRRRKRTDVRTASKSEVENYHERWDLLDHPVDKAPCLLQDWIWDWYDRVPLPNGHPGLKRPRVRRRGDKARSAEGLLPPRS